MSATVVVCVKKPTKRQYLLDLILCSHLDVKIVKEAPKITDHSSVLVKVPDVMETRHLEPRTIFEFDDADWDAIEHEMVEFDWRLLTRGTVDDALAVFVGVLDRAMQAHVPQKVKTVKKSSLPWLNNICYQAINAKHAAEGQDNYHEIATKCREVLLAERKKYLIQLRAKMEKLPRSSKRWWSLNKQLLNKQAAPTLTPPLKNKAGLWCRTPKTKANAFAE